MRVLHGEQPPITGESTPEGFIDEASGELIIKPQAEWQDISGDGNTSCYFSATPRSTRLSRRDLRRLRTHNKPKHQGASFVWIPERDPALGEFGEPLSQEIPLVKLHPTEAREKAIAGSSGYSVDDTQSIVDLDTSSVASDNKNTHLDFPSNAPPCTTSEYRFAYFQPAFSGQQGISKSAFQKFLYAKYLRYSSSSDDGF